MGRLLALSALAAGLLTGTAARPAVAPRPLLPDLYPVQAALRDWDIEETEDGARLLRFTSAIGNLGDGPMEVSGVRRRSTDPFPAYQKIYQSNGTAQSWRVGSFEFHGQHNHWHLLSVAEYRLLDGAGRLAASSRKVSFCLMDMTPVISGAPRYRYGWCPDGRGLLRIVTGISRGWADVYEKGLPDQWIDITSVPPGKYFLQVAIDPGALLKEKSRRNNITTVPVTIPAAGSDSP